MSLKNWPIKTRGKLKVKVIGWLLKRPMERVMKRLRRLQLMLQWRQRHLVVHIVIWSYLPQLKIQAMVSNK